MAVWHHACYMHVPHTPDAENMSRTAHTPAETGAVGGVAWMDTRRAPKSLEIVISAELAECVQHTVLAAVAHATAAAHAFASSPHRAPAPSAASTARDSL